MPGRRADRVPLVRRSGGGAMCGDRSFFQTDRGGSAVGVEAFDACEFLDDGEGFSNGCVVEADDAGAALELVGAEAGEGSSGAAGGEGVAGAGEEVADGDGGEVSEVDGSGGADFGEPLFFVFGDEGEVFGAEVVGDGDAVGEGFEVEEEGAAFEDLADDFGAG